MSRSMLVGAKIFSLSSSIEVGQRRFFINFELEINFSPLPSVIIIERYNLRVTVISEKQSFTLLFQKNIGLHKKCFSVFVQIEKKVLK